MKVSGQMPDTDSGALDKFECDVTPYGFSQQALASALMQMLRNEDLFAYWDEAQPIELSITWGAMYVPNISITHDQNAGKVVVSCGDEEWGRFPVSFEGRAT